VDVHRGTVSCGQGEGVKSLDFLVDVINGWLIVLFTINLMCSLFLLPSFIGITKPV